MRYSSELRLLHLYRQESCEIWKTVVEKQGRNKGEERETARIVGGGVANNFLAKKTMEGIVSLKFLQMRI